MSKITLAELDVSVRQNISEAKKVCVGKTDIQTHFLVSFTMDLTTMKNIKFTKETRDHMGAF